MEFLTEHLQVIITSAAILIGLFIAIAVWRAFSPRMSGRRGQRLGVAEYYEVDKTRRLVLFRRDGVEHLILIGGPQDIVIESGINNSGVAASAASDGPIIPAAGTARPAPRASVFVERKTPPLRAGEAAPSPIRREDPEL